MFFQLFPAFNVISFPTLFPFAFNCTLTLSGRFPSWFSLSFHTFSTLYVVFSTSCVLVIITFPEFSLLYVTVYPVGTSVSSTVYVTLIPFSYSDKLFHVYFQLFSAFNVIVSPSLFPLAFNCTLTLSGRFPSWLLLSFHIFSTDIDVFPGV